MTDPMTSALVHFSLAEAELHDRVDTLEALKPAARSLLKTIGTALLAERRTVAIQISGQQANAFLRKSQVAAEAQMALTMFKGIYGTLCWSLADLSFGWDHTDDGRDGGVYYWSSASICTRAGSFDPIGDFLSPEYNGGGWLWEQWMPRAGGSIPYRAGGPLHSYLDLCVLDIEAAPPGTEIPINTPAVITTDSAPVSRPTRRRRQA